MIWSLETEDSVPQVSNAEVWETYALENQARAGQPQKSSVAEVVPVSVLKSKPSKEQGGVAETEESEDFCARPLWPRKAEYMLALMGYIIKPVSLWRFVYLWLHKGGGKSGKQAAMGGRQDRGLLRLHNRAVLMLGSVAAMSRSGGGSLRT